VNLRSFACQCRGPERRALADKFPYGVVVNPVGLAVAWGSALFLALTFGMYPAIRASRLSPMEAMR
jgi:ABC-type antimicrobial peptide transport system permease subunit